MTKFVFQERKTAEKEESVGPKKQKKESLKPIHVAALQEQKDAQKEAPVESKSKKQESLKPVKAPGVGVCTGEAQGGAEPRKGQWQEGQGYLCKALQTPDT